LDACPICGHDQWTDVCRYNKFLLLERGPDPEAKVYDYAVCHGCGILFARRRPTGRRYVDLLERFEVSLGRARVGERSKRGTPLSSARLDADGAERLRRGAARGVFVSEHDSAASDGYLPELLRDRLAAGFHLELLTSLLDLDRPRVLEIRPRFGALGGGMARHCGATVFGLPLFEGQQLLNREVYGHRVDHLLDCDHFSVPYEGTFDLILSNHMLTHAVRPAEFLQIARDRLAPGGHLYLYSEPDDAEFLEHHASMFKVLNPFHLQAFDRESLLRGLARFGFAPVFVTHERGNLVVLAVRSDTVDDFAPMSEIEREIRIERYRRAHDLSVLRLPPRVQPVFAAEWEAIVERTAAAGLAELTEEGSLRVLRED
jgi:SAM-dependent methyltransferase